jgi:hypothetical protein
VIFVIGMIIMIKELIPLHFPDRQAGYKDELEARVVVSNWMSTRFTLEFLGIWEQIYNPNFNRMKFHTIKNAAERLIEFNKVAITQMRSLAGNKELKQLE